MTDMGLTPAGGAGSVASGLAASSSPQMALFLGPYRARALLLCHSAYSAFWVPPTAETRRGRLDGGSVSRTGSGRGRESWSSVAATGVSATAVSLRFRRVLPLILGRYSHCSAILSDLHRWQGCDPSQRTFDRLHDEHAREVRALGRGDVGPGGGWGVSGAPLIVW